MSQVRAISAPKKKEHVAQNEHLTESDWWSISDVSNYSER